MFVPDFYSQVYPFKIQAHFSGHNTITYVVILTTHLPNTFKTCPRWEQVPW